MPSPPLFASPPTADELAKLDADDPLNWTRAQFELPKAKACGGQGDGDAVYFCGNSLGLLSKKARQYVMEEMDVWSTRSVDSLTMGLMTDAGIVSLRATLAILMGDLGNTSMRR